MNNVPYTEPAIPPQSPDLRRKFWKPTIFGAVFFAPGNGPTGNAFTNGVLLKIGPPTAINNSRTISTPLQ